MPSWPAGATSSTVGSVPPEPRPGGVPFEEAIAFFRQKLRLPTRAWTDLWQGQHARVGPAGVADQLDCQPPAAFGAVAKDVRLLHPASVTSRVPGGYQRSAELSVGRRRGEGRQARPVWEKGRKRGIKAMKR